MHSGIGCGKDTDSVLAHPLIPPEKEVLIGVFTGIGEVATTLIDC
ncbi:hypothetical protein [Thermaurantimonas aggregans]|nr:hypothetical protein [Thermaurantimonas aggregans]